MPRKKTDIITIEVIRGGLISLCNEMGVAMEKTAYSPIFSDGLDFSCAIFDADAEMIAQAAFDPLHLGAMAYAVEWSLEEIGLENLEPGDVVVHNDPFRGGSHLGDFTMIMPVFHEGDIVAIPANRAHQIDFGGKVPGGFAGDATEVFQEGLRLPPVKLWSRGKEVRDLWSVFLSNVRVPTMIRGDMRAMFGSLKVAERRVLEYVKKYGKQRFGEVLGTIKDISEKMMRKEIDTIPDGTYKHEEYLDDDGIDVGVPVRIRVRVTVKRDSLIADYDGSSKQTKGPVNATYGVTASNTFSAVLQVVGAHVPTNHGCYRPIKIIAPPGTVVNADYPAATMGGNVETSARIVEAMLGALGQAVPERVKASDHGTFANLTCGGIHHETGEPYVWYLYREGGWGARPKKDGNSASIGAWSNDKNQPVEIFETSYPWLYEEYSLAFDSAGPGKNRGGLGTRMRMRFLAEETRLSMLGDRCLRSPYGLFSGLPPKASKCGHWNDLLIKLSDSTDFKHVTELFGKGSPTKWSDIKLHRNTIIDYVTTGGGGYGDPLERDPELVLSDLIDDYISVESARDFYGVAIDPSTLTVDYEETKKLRMR
jgi:N-methylhydantoinase B/oxoprolinase/acetone carboxylase alpha subunit